MHIKLDTLRTFIAVADAGALAEASDILGRTPSAISMTLKNFTNELGGELFETDRKSALTPLGQFVLKESRRAISDFDSSMMSIHRYAHGEVGTIRIAAVPSTTLKIIPEATKALLTKTPDIRFELRDADSRTVISSVQNGSVDFGIASLTTSFYDLNVELILEEPFGVICKKNHPLTKKVTPISLQDLYNEKVISNDLFHLTKNPELIQLTAKSHTHIHNNTSLLSFINNGFGLTLLPLSSIDGQENLCFLPLEDKTITRKLFFISRKHYQLSVASNQLKNEIKKYIQTII